MSVDSPVSGFFDDSLKEDGMAAAMTQEKLGRLVRDGLGRGRDDDYKSWIRIRRRVSSPVSNLYSLPNPLHARPLQLLSGLEFQAANVALWLNCEEIREQHPLWPWAHEHPRGGRHPQLDSRLDKVRGLLDIARDANIEHGVYPGTCLPFVATIDFTLTLGPWHDSRLVHWSCKPRDLIESAPNKVRISQRIELEKRYSCEVGAMHVVIDGSQFPDQLTSNLDWLRPLRSELLQRLCQGRLQDYAGHLMAHAAHETLAGAKVRARERAAVPLDLAENYFRAAAWLSLIDIDLAHPVVFSLPLRRDTSGHKRRLRRELLGERS